MAARMSVTECEFQGFNLTILSLILLKVIARKAMILAIRAEVHEYSNTD